MKSEGMRIKKSKRFQYSNDKEFDKKKLVIDIFIDFLEWLLNTIFYKEDIYTILDGWSVHKSHAVKTFAVSRIQVEVLDNSDFQSPLEAIATVSPFFEKELNSS